MRVRYKKGFVQESRFRVFQQTRKPKTMICQVCMAKPRIFENRKEQKQTSFRAFYIKKRRFFLLKTTVSSARNAGFKLKKRRFLKVIRIFLSAKEVYCADYQHLSCNDKNKRFSSPNGNAPANIGCTYA